MYASGALSIAVCDRCGFKVPYQDLRADGNSPGLRVCQREGCWDNFDPWRLPAIQPDAISLQNPRPDVSLVTSTPGLSLEPPGTDIWITTEDGLVIAI